MIPLGKMLGWLAGGLGPALVRAYEARNAAGSEQERIAAEVEIARLHAQQQNRALGGRLTALMQALWAAPFVIYDWKLLVWDKVLAAGATDGLSVSLLEMQLRIATFYFGGAALVGAVRALRR
ncbi:hypothetical protein KM176_21980 [Pseudooceanicola sp. CBS1P-1]|uniref:Uncharacterized protein n=1 Tax=Pseudooceanicola albus TaxID=2692189 RepID=A0A6L7GAL5_9RHOB|nr:MULTISPECIES: hypothetical protein [Pseudooceanicola]MBT9386545.1 hypothetical protein [Pseudooceanicola endophyticus]MXN20578.1 hypothetical protein [Pseudooceanicola albus]